MSKKRARELPSVDISLVEVYEDLAHEDEETRLKAAHRLLTQHLPRADAEHLKSILKRLFRGLCSGRKAARLGFSVALNESLAQIRTLPDTVTTTEIIDILDSTTTHDGSTTGQDERDHYFGRLFGSHAIIKSGLLFEASALTQWQRLLDLLCALSIKKPWLRQECGWALYNCVDQLAKDESHLELLLEIINKLIQHKLVRTPEGLAIWIAARRAGVGSRLPKHIWKHDDPLDKKDLHTLAQVLRDARGTSGDDAAFEVQGSAMWSAQLHFAWDTVVSELLNPSGSHQRVSFAEFWPVAVDDGLFAPQSSKERKHWGFLLLQKVISSSPEEVLPFCFSKNAISCLLQSLKAGDRYLQKDAQRTLNALQTRSTRDPDVAGTLLSALLRSTGMMDFDAVTKTKTIDTVLSSVSGKAGNSVTNSLIQLILRPNTVDESEATKRRRNITNVQAKYVSKAVNKALSQEWTKEVDDVRMVLLFWLNLCEGTSVATTATPAVSKSTRLLVLQKLALAFEQVLKLGSSGRLLLLSCFTLLKDWKLSADAEIIETVQSGWKMFQSHYEIVSAASHVSDDKLAVKSEKHKKHGSASVAHSNVQRSGNEALALLYGLIIFQVHADEAEAVSVLEELIAFEQHSKTDSQTVKNADGIIEILLSFASKPSKFLRRITLEIFGAFTGQITSQGLSSLSDILQTKESKAGQEELFDANGSLSGDEDAEHDTVGSDVEMLDSDVEIVNGNASESGSDAESDRSSHSDDGSKSGSELSEAADPDLIALETSLAQALGTRKLTTGDVDASSTGSDSDSDMDDDQMLSLDAKLSEVFRTRAAAHSQSKSKQKENRTAKETMTNFKNRVLDMIEVYFKNEAQNSNSLFLILPLLSLTRTTAAKQLAERAVNLIKTLCSRCKGLQNAPVLAKSSSAVNVAPGEEESDAINDDKWALSIFRGIHEEVCLPASNAHKAVCSQSSILLVKTLLQAGVAIEEVLSVYSETQTRMLVDENVAVQEAFFRDWIGWCGSVKGKLGKGGVAVAPTSTSKPKAKGKGKLRSIVNGLSDGNGVNHIQSRQVSAVAVAVVSGEKHSTKNLASDDHSDEEGLANGNNNGSRTEGGKAKKRKKAKHRSKR